MNDEEVLSQLQEVLDELNIELKYGRGYFEGGLCRYRESRYIYLNRAQNIENHISVILTELRKMNLDNIDLKPSVKALLTKRESN